jgi:hypothetical protein
MALLQNTVTNMGSKPSSDKTTESIFTANQQLNKPTKVSGRPIEVVPRQAEFDPVSSQKMVDFAKSQAVSGKVSGNSLVQNQLNSVLAKNGPLMKRARENAAMATTERGLNNSSIGVQAGEEAAISSALPIAQQDASTHANMDITNLNAKNQFANAGVNQAFTQLNQKNDQIFSAGENQKGRDQQLLMQGNDQIFSAGENQKGRDFTAGESAAERQMRERQEQLAREFQSTERQSSQQFSSDQAALASDRQLNYAKTMEDLTAKNNLAMEDIRFEHQQALNSNATAQAIYANHQQQVSALLSQPNLHPEQAKAALQILNQTTADNLALAGSLSGLDLSAYAPNSELNGSAEHKDGNVLNPRFIAITNQARKRASEVAAGASSEAKGVWLNEEVHVELDGYGGKAWMTRAEAIKRGLLEDDFREKVSAPDNASPAARPPSTNR